MRTSVTVAHCRRILCVFPAYAPSFGTFSHAYKLMPGVRAFMPPQGLLLIAAYMPAQWPVRVIDENIRPASAADLAWADVVLVSGMHIQAPQIRDIARRAHAAGKVVAVGGPSVSASPEMYPEIDYLHIGELGDATDALIARLDESVAPPAAQMRFETAERLALTDFPIPAYDLVPLRRYLMLTLQFSSGCPYRCEFCDIPGLYGRQPRLKTPQQITAELDAMRAQRHPPAVYFVDDNFIGNRKATREMLPHLVAWQKQHGYPLQLSCEATLNIAKQTEILALMREASFKGIFVGIETPEADALKAMRKEHNVALPMMQAIETLNRYGLEVTAGIILGLDTDSPDTEARLANFIDLSCIPILTINLLQALPKTPLWDRLARENRLIEDDSRDSNVDFLLPYDQVVDSWKKCMKVAFEPERLYARYQHQVDFTYSNRIKVPVTQEQKTWANIKRGLIMLRNIFWKVGVLGDYKKVFWKFALPRLKHGDIEGLISVALVAHHLITFARLASVGQHSASNYSIRLREASVPAE